MHDSIMNMCQGSKYITVNLEHIIASWIEVLRY